MGQAADHPIVEEAPAVAGGAEIIIPRWQPWAKAAKKRLQAMMAAEAEKPAA